MDAAEAMVLADAAVFRRKRWYYMVLDEAHYIKNYASARWQTLAYSPLVVAASLLPVAMGFGHRVYLASALLLGVGFVVIAGLGVSEREGIRWARGLFVYSIVYLTVLLGVLVATAGHLKA